MAFSGIITTNLGKTATFDKVAGRERRVHHSKSLPLPLIGERHFFIRNPLIFIICRQLENARKRLCNWVFSNLLSADPWTPRAKLCRVNPDFLFQFITASAPGDSSI